MNWKDEALEKLRNYDALRTALCNIPQQLEQLEQEAGALRSVRTDGVRVIGGGGSRENALINNLVERQELAQNFHRAQQQVAITDRALGTLTPQEKLVLSRLYICPERGALDRLCSELGVEQSSIYRKRDRALRRFTMAYYGVDS